MIRVCGRLLRIQTLWLLWYAGLGLFAHAYLLYRAAARCRQFWTAPWPPDDVPWAETISYVLLIVISFICAVLFFICAVFKVDNYANDNLKLGRENVLEELKRPSLVQPSPSRVLWQHAPPTAAALHLLLAFSLLLPLVFLDAMEIRRGFRHHGYAWMSNMDFLYGTQRIARLTFNFTSIVLDRVRHNMTIDVEPVVPFDGWSYSLIQPEFVNWIFALIMFSIRYATVFWSTSRFFSAIFSLQMMSTSINFLFTFSGVSILYKFKLNEQLFYYPKITLVLPSSAVLILFAILFVVMCLSSCIVFSYGYILYQREHEDFMQKHRPPYLRKRYVNQPSCYGYTPHILASCTLVLIVGLKAPLLMDFMNWYRHTRDRLVLSCVVVDACYMLFWVVLWFGLTLKHGWEFKIESSELLPEGSKGKMQVYTIQNSQTQHRSRESVSSASPRSSVLSSMDSTIIVADSSREGSTVDLLPMPNPRADVTKQRKRAGRRVARDGLNRRTTDKDDLGLIVPPLTPERSKEAHLRMLQDNYKRRSASSDPGPNLLTPQHSDVDSCNDSEQDQKSDSLAVGSQFNRDRGGVHYPRRSKPPPVVRTLSLQLESNKYNGTMMPISENMELKDFRAGPHVNPVYQIHPDTPMKMANKMPYTNIQITPNRHLNRDIKIVTKPDASRRDSGAPSSQETSSNDSGDNNTGQWSRV